LQALKAEPATKTHALWQPEARTVSQTQVNPQAVELGSATPPRRSIILGPSWPSRPKPFRSRCFAQPSPQKPQTSCKQGFRAAHELERTVRSRYTVLDLLAETGLQAEIVA